MITKVKILLFMVILSTLSLLGCNRDSFATRKTNFSIDGISITSDAEVTIIDRKIVIYLGGEYELTGSGENIQIVVESVEPVKIIFEGLEIINIDRTPLDIISGSQVIIECIGKNSSSLIVKGVDKITCIKSNGSLNLMGNATLNLEGYTCIKAKKEIDINMPINISSHGDGVKAEKINIASENVNIYAGKDSIQADEININSGTIMINGTSDKSRGMYSKRTINIYGGHISINTIDDAISSKESIFIISGTITLDTKDDAIHAGESINIDGGIIIINSCYEGIESGTVTINNGEIYITSINDGINAARDEKDSAMRANVYQIAAAKIVYLAYTVKISLMSFKLFARYDYAVIRLGEISYEISFA